MRHNGPMAEETKRKASPLTVLLVLLLIGVLAASAWCIWIYVGTNLAAKTPTATALNHAEAAVATHSNPTATTEAKLPPPAAGEPAWVLDIPKLDLRVAVIAGTEPESLRQGVGWYPTTNLPGEVGNCAIAGHHTTDGKPFAKLQHLAQGDKVIVETPLARYTYEIRVAPNELTVQADDSWVLDPVPGKDFTPHESILTLTTEQDLVPTSDRSVAFAVLVNEERT